MSLVSLITNKAKGLIIDSYKWYIFKTTILKSQQKKVLQCHIKLGPENEFMCKTYKELKHFKHMFLQSHLYMPGNCTQEIDVIQ